MDSYIDLFIFLSYFSFCSHNSLFFLFSPLTLHCFEIDLGDLSFIPVLGISWCR